MKITFLLFVSLSAAVACFAQADQDKLLTKSIDELISSRLGQISPGCAILVGRKGQVFYNKAFGIANLELNVPAQPDMVFRIGSITKQFTAVAVLQLVEQGKISLSDSIQKFIAGFPVEGHRITIENLLTQTSGIPDYLDLEYSSPNAFRIDFTPAQVIDSLKKQSLVFAPSSKFAYSNSNYFLLGYIIEAVSGLSYPEYLRQHIFKPFLLTNTYYDRPTDIIPNRVNGYERSGDKYRNADFISMAAFYSAGAIISNTADLLKWNEALMHGSIIKKETLDQAFRPFTLAGGKSSEYGYGWFIRTLEGSKTIEHGGSVFGFRSEEIFLPAENIYIAGLFNCRQLNNDEQELCYDIARLVLGKPLVKEFAVSEETLHQYIGVYKNDQYNLTMTIHSGPGGRIYCDLSNGTGTNMTMSAQSKTLFVLPQIKRIHTTLQFITENGAVVKIICSQETPVEFKRVE